MALLLLLLASLAAAEDYLVPILMPKIKPPNKPDILMCKGINLMDINSEETLYIKEFHPHADKSVVHHATIFGCAEAGSSDPAWVCGLNGNTDDGIEFDIAHGCDGEKANFFYWALNAESLILPKGVGFKVGKGTPYKYLILNIHYNTVDVFQGENNNRTDDSGHYVKLTTEVQPNIANVFNLNTVARIPPHQMSFMDSACDYTAKETIHVFAYRTHTHDHGTKMIGYRVRKQREQFKWTQIARRSPQQPQQFVLVDPVEVHKGDILASRCWMKNSNDTTIKMGNRHENEMCILYLMYYAKGPDGFQLENCINRRNKYTHTNYNWDWYPLDNIPDDAYIPHL